LNKENFHVIGIPSECNRLKQIGGLRMARMLWRMVSGRAEEMQLKSQIP